VSVCRPILNPTDCRKSYTVIFGDIFTRPGVFADCMDIGALKFGAAISRLALFRGDQALCNVSPSSSTTNATNSDVGHSISISNFNIGARIFQYGKDLGLRQFAGGGGLSVGMTLFINAIGFIIKSGPEKQMSRVCTRGIVASMANFYAFRNGAYVKFIRSSMRQSLFALFCKSPIAIFVSSPKPSPTLRVRRLDNIFRHGLLDGTWFNATFKFIISIPYFARTFGTRFRTGFNPGPPFMAASFTL